MSCKCKKEKTLFLFFVQVLKLLNIWWRKIMSFLPDYLVSFQTRLTSRYGIIRVAFKILATATASQICKTIMRLNWKFLATCAIKNKKKQKQWILITPILCWFSPPSRKSWINPFDLIGSAREYKIKMSANKTIKISNTRKKQTANLAT